MGGGEGRPGGKGRKTEDPLPSRPLVAAVVAAAAVVGEVCVWRKEIMESDIENLEGRGLEFISGFLVFSWGLQTVGF